MRRKKKAAIVWWLLIPLLLVFACAWFLLWKQEQKYREWEDPNYSIVEEGLYLGGYVRRPPPGTQAVVNVSQRKDDYEMQYHLWEPIVDGGEAPSIDWLRRVVGFVDEQRQAQRTTYIHCMAGVSRSGLVAAAYLMSKNRWTRDEALAFLRSKRPQVQPNPAFMELLAKWEQELQRPTSETLGVFAPLVGALVFKTSGGFEQSSQWVRFPYTPVKY